MGPSIGEVANEMNISKSSLAKRLPEVSLFSFKPNTNVRQVFSMAQEIACVCVPMLTHCTITCFEFRARWVDGVECGLF